MKFKIDRQTFLNGLNISQKALASKSNMPAMMGILLYCETDKLILITSNGEISIKQVIMHESLEIDNEGKCLIPGKFFCDIIRKLNGNLVDIELEEDNILRIQTEKSDITLNLLYLEDYPVLNMDVQGEELIMSSTLIKDIIKETTFAASISDSRPILMGVNFKLVKNHLLAVATDSFRLSRKETVLDKEYLDQNVIIPARSLNELSKILGEEDQDLKIVISSRKITFMFGGTTFQTRLFEGNYPDTTKLIPTSFPIVIKFNKKEMEESIDRVSTLSSSNNSPIIKLQIEGNGKVLLTANTPELGTIKDEITPTQIVSNGSMNISFSSTYFLDALRAFSSEEIIVEFAGLNKQFILEAENDKGLIELVLPVKVE